MRKELHVISISGGKDSAALAIYMKEKYPDREFKYLFFDTEEELQDTYDYLNKLQSILGIKVEYKFPEKSFKELLLQHNDYLPSPTERWCTRKMKLETFLNTMQEFKEYTIYNYVGIRADENREGLNRVGCNICPFASQWSDYIINKQYPNIARKFIDTIDDCMDNSDIENKKEYLELGHWKKRAGGNSIMTKNTKNYIPKKIA